MCMPYTFDNEVLYEEREDGTTEIWYSRECDMERKIGKIV